MTMTRVQDAHVQDARAVRGARGTIRGKRVRRGARRRVPGALLLAAVAALGLGFAAAGPASAHSAAVTASGAAHSGLVDELGSFSGGSHGSSHSSSSGGSHYSSTSGGSVSKSRTSGGYSGGSSYHRGSYGTSSSSHGGTSSTLIPLLIGLGVLGLVIWLLVRRRRA